MIGEFDNEYQTARYIVNGNYNNHYPNGDRGKSYQDSMCWREQPGHWKAWFRAMTGKNVKDFT